MNHRKCFHPISCIVLLGFLLGVHNGYVALWKDGSEKPAYVSDYPVDMLPPADQDTLRSGIHFDDRASLTKALEDFLS